MFREFRTFLFAFIPKCSNVIVVSFFESFFTSSIIVFVFCEGVCEGLYRHDFRINGHSDF